MDEKQSQALSPDEITSIAMPVSGTIVKMESMEMTALARQNPRNHAVALADVLTQLKTYPSFAKAAIYSKPVGTVMRVTCKCGRVYETPIRWEDRRPVAQEEPCPKCNKWNPDKQRSMQKYARGLSIRAAEALLSAWGNCAASVITSDDTDDYTEMAAVFLDYEKCTKLTFPVRVSKSYKARGGKIVKHPSDRFASVVLAAERSKALREVITRSIPPGLRQELYEKAEEIIEGLLDEGTQAKLIAAFAELGVSQQQLEQHVDKTLIAFTKQDRADLLGVFNAIKEGETTLEQAFPAETNGGASTSAPDGAPKADSATVKPNSKPAEAPQVTAEQAPPPISVPGPPNEGSKPEPKAPPAQQPAPAAEPTGGELFQTAPEKPKDEPKGKPEDINFNRIYPISVPHSPSIPKLDELVKRAERRKGDISEGVWNSFMEQVEAKRAELTK